MIRWAIGLVVVFVAAVFGISIYLQPDDLRSCGKTPGTDKYCQTVDAIVAVSGGDTQARTKAAIDLYNNGWAKTLIFSGAAQDKTGPSNAATMKDIAISAGVLESDIQIDEYSETTKQNAENTGTIFSRFDIKTVILVTSGYHQRRSSLEFNKRTNDVNILNHPVKSDKDWSAFWWITPRGWWLASSELVKVSVFYVYGMWL